MIKRDGYDINGDFNDQKVQFKFTSTGKVTIEKMVEFKRIGINRWNLGFGDVKGDDWTDDVISNNNDWRKVLQTVANVVHHFFDRFPEDEVLILPLDHQRKLLYNRIFQQKWHEIDPLFIVKAVPLSEIRPKFEDYTPLKLFNYFTRKPNV